MKKRHICNGKKVLPKRSKEHETSESSDNDEESSMKTRHIFNGKDVIHKRSKEHETSESSEDDKEASDEEETEEIESDLDPDENDLALLGAMDRYKVANAARKGKTEARKEYKAALERNQAMEEARELGSKKRKIKDKVRY